MAASKKTKVGAAAGAALVLVGGSYKVARTLGDDVVRTGVDDVVRTGVDDAVRTGVDDAVRTGVDDAVRTGVDDGIRTGVDDGIRTGVDDGIRTGGEPAQLESVDSFSRTVTQELIVSREDARIAGVGAACEVLRIAIFEQRLPDERDLVGIGVAAFAAIGYPQYQPPMGSPMWQGIEQVKDEVSDAISDGLGFPDKQEADSLADELACAWTG